MGKFFGVIKKAVRDFGEDDCMSSAAAMAYYAIFSLPPLLVMVVSLAGYFGVSPDEIQKMVQDQWGVASSNREALSLVIATRQDEQTGDEQAEVIQSDRRRRQPGLWGCVARGRWHC